MKYLWSIIFVLLLAVASWFWLGLESDDQAVSPVTLDSRQQPVSAPNVSLAEKLREAQQTQPNLISAQEQTQLTELALNKRKEIEQQIELLNENLQDPNERKAIQANLKLLLEEYNQMALPLALNQLSAQQ